MKRFGEGDMVFLDQPKYEPKTGKERDNQIDKSKLLPKSTGPFRFICEYRDVIVVNEADAELPVYVCRCSKAPANNINPTNHKLESDMKTRPSPHPIVNENSKFFSDGSAHHPSKTMAANSPLQITHQVIDPKNISAPEPFPMDNTTTAFREYRNWINSFRQQNFRATPFQSPT